MTVYRTTGWQIRTATSEDVEAPATMRLRLQDHMAHANHELLPMSARGIASVPERYREALADANAHVLVVQVLATEALVGMAMGRIVLREDLAPAHAGRINDVWVDPPYRRQGMCRALVQQLLAFFERYDVQVLVLDYAVGNVEAEDTWRQFGFRPVLTLATANVGDVQQRTGGCTV